MRLAILSHAARVHRWCRRLDKFNAKARAIALFGLVLLVLPPAEVAGEPVIRTWDIESGDMVYDATRERLWLSVRASSELHANRVVGLDPETMTVERTISVGPDPLHLAISDDMRFLYVSLDGAPGYQRIDLDENTVSPTYTLSAGSDADLFVHDMEVLPGEPHAVAIVARPADTFSNFRHLAIYDDDVPRPDQIPRSPNTIDHIRFGADSSSLFGGNGGAFHRMEVDAEGVRHVDETRGVLLGPKMRYLDGWMLAARGVVFDPQNLEMIGFLSADWSVNETIVDRNIGRFFQSEDSGHINFRVTAYETETFTRLNRFTNRDALGNPIQMVRWGSRGLAIRTEEDRLVVIETDLVSSENPEANLRTEIMTHPTQRIIGEPFTYQIRVENAGPDAAHQIVLSHDAPEDVTLLSGSAPDGEVTVGEGNLSVGWPSLAVNESREVAVEAVASSAGRFSLQAQASASTGDPQPASSTSQGWLHVNPVSRDHTVLAERSLLVEDLVKAPGSGLLYASIKPEDPLYGNLVIVIDPETGEVVNKFAAGANPTRLAVSDGGGSLYVATQDGFNVNRINLRTGEIDLSFDLGIGDSDYLRAVRSMQVMPEAPDSLAVAFQISGDPKGVAVFDSGLMRPETSPRLHRVTSIAVDESRSRIYGFDGASTSDEFHRFSVDESGVTHLDATEEMLPERFNRLTYFEGLVYSSAGTVIDPENRTLAGEFGNDPADRRSLALLPETNRALFLRQTGEIEAFEMDTFDPTAHWRIPHIPEVRAPLVLLDSGRMAFAGPESLIILESRIAELERSTLSVEVDNEPMDMRVGMSWTYTIRVTNDGATPVTDMRITQPRESFLNESVNATRGTVTTTSSYLEVHLETVEPGGTVEVNVTIRPARTRTYTPTFEVTTIEADENPSIRVRELPFEPLPEGELTFDIPAEGREGDGVLEGAGTIALGEAEEYDVAIPLESSLTSKLTVPETVIVPAGETSATFDLTVVDNDLLDGTRTVEVTVQPAGIVSPGAGFVFDPVSMDVHDNDTAAITVTLPETVRQGENAMGEIVIDRAADNTFTVALSADHHEWLSLPDSVILEPGEDRASFDVTIADVTPPVEGQAVTVTASVPDWSDGSATIRIFPPAPKPPFNPSPLTGTRFTSHSPTLAWNDTPSIELLANGRFATGDFHGWDTDSTGGGGWAINDGAYDPPGPVGPLPPLSEGYGAVSYQTEAGTNRLSQDVLLPYGAERISLRWADSIQNSAGQYTPDAQEFRVEIHESEESFHETVFETEPGYPLITSWQPRAADLTQFHGERIRLAFTQTDSEGFLNVYLDNVSIVAEFPEDTSIGEDAYDVYFGTTPYLDEEDFLRTVDTPTLSLENLEPGTTYYWQVVIHRGDQTAAGPVWSFRTAGVDAAVTAPNGPTTEEPLEFQVIFTEPVTPPSVEDFYITNFAEAAVSGEGSEYTVTVVPEGYGNVTVEIPKNVVHNGEGGGNAPAGASVFYAGAASFSRWREMYFSAEERQQDPEGTGLHGDAGGTGVPNLLRYAFGMRDGVVDRSLLPHVVMEDTDDGPYAMIVFHWQQDPVDIEYVIEVSEDLRNWTAAEDALEILFDEKTGSTRRIGVRHNHEPNGGQQRFMRLRVIATDGPEAP